jgi:hypothetical protein
MLEVRTSISCVLGLGPSRLPDPIFWGSKQTKGRQPPLLSLKDKRREIGAVVGALALTDARVRASAAARRLLVIPGL